jgi:predicted ATP-binding protein involved in virulence
LLNPQEAGMLNMGVSKMKLKNIKIEKLFGQFDYDIELNQEEGITILTGPNGYGKTTVLNIVYYLHGGNSGKYYLSTLKINNLETVYDDGTSIKLTDTALKSVNNSNSVPPFKQMEVVFIKDQRLKQEIEVSDGPFIATGVFAVPKKKEVKNTIILYSTEMAQLLSRIKQKENELSEQLTSSQFNRIKSREALSADEYKNRFNNFLQKYNRLYSIGIYSDPLADTEYVENKQYLTVFLEDFEQRVALYNEIIPKIVLFDDILGQKLLNEKTVRIDRREGFLVQTLKNEKINLNSLSSGEQQEIILLYELLFRSKPGTLVLIDEPETSMHVAWQQLFLKDLEQIGKLNSLSFLVATHSPDIIGDKLKWVVDLYELSQRDAE